MQQQNRIKPRSYSALFLLILLVHILADVFVSILENKYSVPLWLELVISESTIIIPGLIWMLIYNVSFTEGLGFKKIKISTILMTVLLSYLLMPLISLINLISQLFTVNEVVQISPDVLGSNSLLMIFIMGFFGPFCEEFIFRGIICKGMNRFASIFASSLVSGLFFGLMHLNLNQFCYAFVLGLIFGVANYATGSIYTSVVMHTVVNSHNVILLIVMGKVLKILGIDSFEASMESAEMISADKNFIYFAIGIFLILALIFTLVSIPVFNFIACNEGNQGCYTRLFEGKSNAGDGKKDYSWWLNPYSIVAIIICIVLIFFLERILMIFGL